MRTNITESALTISNYELIEGDEVESIMSDGCVRIFDKIVDIDICWTFDAEDEDACLELKVDGETVAEKCIEVNERLKKCLHVKDLAKACVSVELTNKNSKTCLVWKVKVKIGPVTLYKKEGEIFCSM